MFRESCITPIRINNVEKLISDWLSLGNKITKCPTPPTTLPNDWRYTPKISLSTPLLEPLKLGPKRKPRTKKTDHRIVLAILPNPKRPGSACFERYKLWQIGCSVSELIAKGLRPEDVRWDIKQGFVKVGFEFS